MKNFKKFISVLLLVTVVFTVVGCKKPGDEPFEKGDDGMAKLTYPDLPHTGNEKNSWEYIENENIKIKWYVDTSTWNAPSGIDAISAKIKEKTGIEVEFETPVQDDGQKLATMIAGGDLPDVITLPTSQSKQLASLAQQGYVYDINTLADYWAPSLYNNVPEDVLEWWSYGNGKTYGIPNHYYSYEDVPDEQLQPNGGMMVRKDIFDAFQRYVETNLKGTDGKVTYTSRSTGEQKKVEWKGYITTPEGFKHACTWALENYSGTGNGQIVSGLQLSQFRSDGCTSLKWLSQMFAIAYEDKDGNYVYDFTNPEYEEMLYWLNELYSTKVGNYRIISDSNFTAKYDNFGGEIASGKVFATLVTPQDYQMHFVTAKDSGYEYITMYITNEDGDAPILSDIRGYGYLFNMITTNCKRPDLVIKLFDYLSSDEGQRLVTLGEEGVTWNFKDGTDEIVFTEKYLSEKADGTYTKYGLMFWDVLLNYQYYDNVQPKENHGKTANELFRTNLKRPLTIYAYDCNAGGFVVDATDERFSTYNTNLTRINELIGRQLPKIIKASNRTAAEKVYNDLVKLMKDRGLDLIITMNSEAYIEAKRKLGVEYGWPGNQPGYENKVDRNNPNGDLSLYRGY